MTTQKDIGMTPEFALRVSKYACKDNIMIPESRPRPHIIKPKQRLSEPIVVKLSLRSEYGLTTVTLVYKDMAARDRNEWSVRVELFE